MTVVINEFEVIAEPPAAAAVNAESEAAANEIAMPPAFEIERIERFLADRALRIWAH